MIFILIEFGFRVSLMVLKMREKLAGEGVIEEL